MSAVSDCVFLFCDERLEFANAEGDSLLRSIGPESDYLIALLRETASRPREQFPITLQTTDEGGQPIRLAVRSAMYLTLEQRNAVLVTVENKSVVAYTLKSRLGFLKTSRAVTMGWLPTVSMMLGKTRSRSVR